jgi:hypothetical protein
MLCFRRNKKQPGIAQDPEARHAVSVIHVSNGVQAKEASTKETDYERNELHVPIIQHSYPQ